MSSLQRLSREDYRRKKELEELRKAGAAPAEVDDEGNMINPHIPQYMAEAPWYVSDGKPGLKHLKKQKKVNKATFYDRTIKGLKAFRNKKFCRGACENCGATTHSIKNCCERPRKRGAKWSGSNIRPDEYLQNKIKNYDYDGKRDNWKNYNIDDHKKLINHSLKIEQARKIKQNNELDMTLQKSTLKNNSDGDNIKDPGIIIQQMTEKKRQTVRNLRTREDTAKYLRNLDLNSAFYDPKTRSMRSNPYKKLKNNASNYIGDNFLRISGDAYLFKNQEKLAQDLDKRGNETLKGVIQIAANPTKSELVLKDFENKEQNLKLKKFDNLIKRYGCKKEYRNLCMPKESFDYKEYDNAGMKLKTKENKTESTKYLEDIYESGHIEIWGSYFNNKTKSWGYACCQNTVRENICKNKF